jgi:hypothetical protein
MAALEEALKSSFIIFCLLGISFSIEVGIIPKSNIKIVEKDKIDTLTHKYLIAHFFGFL